MHRLTYKEQVTKTVYEQLNDRELTIEQAYKQWWKNPRRNGGYRLTEVGDTIFRYTGLEYHTHDFKTKNKSYYNFLLDLDKKIKCPYYIGVNKDKDKKQPFIRLYDSKVAMMVQLYGNINDYLKSIRIKK